MITNSTTFESVTSAMLRILKEDLQRTDGTLESYLWKWNHLKRFMETNDIRFLTPKVCDDFLLSKFGSKDPSLLSYEKKKFLSAILLLKGYLINGVITPRYEGTNVDKILEVDKYYSIISRVYLLNFLYYI